MTQNQSGKQLFEWIRATKRLPEVWKDVCIRTDVAKKSAGVEYYVGRLDQDLITKVLSFDLFNGSRNFTSEDFASIEWLDESPAQPSTGKPTEEFEVKKFQETISCPECEHVQKATVELTIPWPTFIHYCEKCNYLIMESEWNKVENPSTGKQLPTDEEIEAYAERASSEYLDEVVEYSIKREIVKACQWILAQGESDKWIRVEDGLPEADGNYLIVFINSAGRHVGEAYFMEGMFWDDVDSQPQLYSFVTHWQPLPNAPITNNQK